MSIYPPLELSEAGDQSQTALKLKVELIKELGSSFLEELQSLGAARPLDLERGISLYDEVRRFEVNLITCALKHTKGRQRAAAHLLGIKATTLNAKIKNYKISTENFLRLLHDRSAPTGPAVKSYSRKTD